MGEVSTTFAVVLFVVGCVVVASLAVYMFLTVRPVKARLDPKIGEAATTSTDDAIRSAGGIEPLITERLELADAAIGAARRAGDAFSNRRMVQFAAGEGTSTVCPHGR
jgi:hypothetical protein